MENIIHSQWKNEDIISLIPELTDALKDSAHINPQQIYEKMDDFLQKQVDLFNHAKRESQTISDIDGLCNGLKAFDDLQASLRKGSIFLKIAEIHYTQDSGFPKDQLQKWNHTLEQLMGVTSDSHKKLIAVMATLDDAVVDQIMKARPSLLEYKYLIDKNRETPNRDKVVVEGLKDSKANFAENMNNLARSMKNNSDMTEEERKELFAKSLGGIILHKQQLAESAGFKDTIEQFAFNNSAPLDIIDSIGKFSDKNIENLNKLLGETTQLLLVKLDSSKITKMYNFDEAKDIVCTAYAQLDPELGKLAHRALEEGWIRASQTGVNPHTISSVPVDKMAGTHPFATTNFDNKAFDVVALGHEMAHVLSNYIAGQKQGVFTYDASMMIQESFSHFGELLVENEMLKRTDDEHKKAYLKYMALGKEIKGSINLLAVIKFEDSLYKLVKEKNGKVSFDEINNIFQNEAKGINTSDNVMNFPSLWNIVQQPPHNNSVYPIAKIMSAALFDEYKKEPEKFRKNYIKMMEDGGTIGISEFWNTMLGNNKEEQKEFVQNRVGSIAARITDLKQELESMPDMPKKEDEKPIAGGFAYKEAHRPKMNRHYGM